jgi:hypothetical protein
MAAEELKVPEHWQSDKLGRYRAARMLTKYVTSKFESSANEAFVLNLNAGWGLGKTFFLDRWAKDLEAEQHAVIFLMHGKMISPINPCSDSLHQSSKV